VPIFADRGCHVVSTMDIHGHILGFLDQSRYYFFQVSPQLYSRGCVDHVPDPLLLRKSGSARNRTRDIWICSQELGDLGPYYDWSVFVVNHPPCENEGCCDFPGYKTHPVLLQYMCVPQTSCFLTQGYIQ
jgi:hypothetical protein